MMFEGLAPTVNFESVLMHKNAVHKNIVHVNMSSLRHGSRVITVRCDSFPK